MEISKRNYNEECGQAQDVSPPCGVGAGAGGQHSIRLKILIVDSHVGNLGDLLHF